MIGNRTLSFKGEKSTFGKVRSIHNTTHSYTVQFITSLSGQPIGNCYLCLKEKNGHMSNNIKKDLFRASNVTVTCSQSGKLTSSLVEYWIRNVLKPAVGNGKSIIIIGCLGWSNGSKIILENETSSTGNYPKEDKFDDSAIGYYI
ncbi:unnamed protein product [Adineta ricciae]|uniref:Uncharacterized protein n=2 Tax=Adineta ricciae TaxID=249248 RepID=A0A815TSL3_ADIRI|nr:unnamed protein product [Adineta ricciae]